MPYLLATIGLLTEKMFQLILISTLIFRVFVLLKEGGGMRTDGVMILYDPKIKVHYANAKFFFQ